MYSMRYFNGTTQLKNIQPIPNDKFLSLGGVKSKANYYDSFKRLVGLSDTQTKGEEHMTNREAIQQALEAKSLAGILLREHDNVEQAINYAERMAQRCADSRSLMAMEYQDAAKELKAWKQSKPF